MRIKQIWSSLVPFLTMYCWCFSGLNAQNLFFEKITGREVNPVTQIHGIAKDSVGYIWIGSWNGVYRYDGKTFDFFYHIPNDKTSLPNNRIRNIISDQKRGLWFLTFDNKYVKFDYQLNTFKVIADDKVPEILVEKLSSNANQLHKNRIVNGKSYFLSLHQFTSQDVKAGEKYVYKANINHPGQLVDDYITDFFIDNQNTIWLGTRGGDVYKANPNRNPFELHYSFRKDSGNSRFSIVKAVLKVAGKIWLGTDDGILIYNKEELDNSHPFYKSGSRIKFVRTLLKDDKGGIWIGGINGLEYYDPKTNRCKWIINKDLCPDLSTWSVYALEASGSNYLWVGLYNGIARVHLTSKAIDFIDLTDKINNHSVMDILSVDDRQLWLATEGNGVILLKIDSKGKVYDEIQLNTFQKNVKNTISGNIIYALHQDKNRNIWVGTSEGLNKIDVRSNPMRIEKVQLHSETPNSYISSITDDAKGNLWIAHKKGISMVDLVSNKISNFHKEDQFGSWTFSERAFYKDTVNQKIYFGDKNGYLAFNPSEIKTVVNNNKLIFKTLYLSDEKVIPMDTVKGRDVLTKDLSQTESIHLEYENRNFAIELASLNYNRTNKEVYEYILEGYDDKWIKTTNSKITYNKVPPGTYVFKARLLSSDNTKSPLRALKIHVEAPWYDTWLARILFSVLIIGIVYWIIKGILYRERLKNEIKSERLNAEKQQELNREKLEFFTNISHDLKTPLTLIVDPLKRIQDNTLAPGDKEVYFSIVNRNISYLSKLIAQILDFRKSETGKLKSNPTVQDFNVFIESCYNTFKFISTKRNIALQLHTSEKTLPCYLDFEKTEQIITNIVSNAFKYTPDGGKVTISVTHNTVAATIDIVIEDNGIGIEESELEKIFEPFNNVGPSPYYGYSSGIGLSLTRNLVHFLNGTINIESVLNKGTKVFIRLPFVAAASEDVVELVPEKTFFEDKYPVQPIDEQPFEGAKPTLLIVEDNPDIQTYLNKELSKDYIVFQEYDGKKGLETAIKQIPDIIVSDIMMPEMEGTELCKALKSDENTCHVPVILLTAKGADESKIEAYHLGAEAYVMKPFNVEVLRAQIKSVLENRIILQKKMAGIATIEQLQEEMPNQDNEFLEKIIHLIHLNMEDVEFNSEELAKLLHISSRQLYRKLKGISGNTVHEFITKVKMNQAEELLRNSDLNISQIAYKLGFSEPSNFSRTFSKYFGCSPSQYGK
ncbi:ATP-binding protein [Flavobacterium sp. ARAG 55.4]|uniref:hybrid sensor histidine kinase/response regulator transcription factor n=1 Tax=Flavobacterium sp. ARAG 55.4 TaxID=3451357 RepID=UPI003F46E42B